MISSWRLVVPALAVLAAASASVPLTSDAASGGAGRALCDPQEGPPIPAAERAEVTRAATRAITVLGPTERNGDSQAVAVEPLLSEKRHPSAGSFTMGGTTERVSGVAAIGITSRCTRSGPYGLRAGQLTLMAAGHVKITGRPPEPSTSPNGLSVQRLWPDAETPRPGETIERVRRWTLTMVPTRQGWRASTLYEHLDSDMPVLRIEAKVKSKRPPSPTEHLMGQVGTALKKIFSYRHGDPAATSRAAYDHLLGDARRRHQAMFAPIVDHAAKNRTDVVGSMEGLGILRNAGGSATLMAFLNLESSDDASEHERGSALPSDMRALVEPPDKAVLALSVTAVVDGGRWRISDIRSLV